MTLTVSIYHRFVRNLKRGFILLSFVKKVGYLIGAAVVFGGAMSAAVKGNGTQIKFDSNADGASEMVLDGTGLAIGASSASANLSVVGNAIITDRLTIGSSTMGSSNLHVSGTIAYSMGSYAAGSNQIAIQPVVLVDTSAGDTAIGLPKAENYTGQTVMIKRTNSAANLMISAAGTSMDQYGVIALASGNQDSVTMFSDGNQWYIMGKSASTVLSELAKDNILVWWKLDETSGSVAADASTAGTRSGNLLNGHLFSGNSIAGAVGRALRFDDPAVDQTDSVDHINSTANIYNGSAYSFSLWVNSETTPSLAVIDTTIDGVMGFAWGNSDSSWRQTFYHKDSSGSYVKAHINSTISANTWNHIAGTWDGSAMKVYLNGVYESGNSVSTWAQSSGNLTLGNPATAVANNVFHMDQFLVYSKALSEMEVKSLYLSGNVSL